MTKRVTSTREKIAIHTLLISHMTTFEDNTCTYDEGWSDERICSELCIDGLTLSHVASIRRATLGKLHMAAKSGHITNKQRLTISEQRLDRIIDHIAGGSPNSTHYRDYLLHGTTAVTPASADDL